MHVLVKMDIMMTETQPVHHVITNVKLVQTMTLVKLVTVLDLSLQIVHALINIMKTLDKYANNVLSDVHHVHMQLIHVPFVLQIE